MMKLEAPISTVELYRDFKTFYRSVLVTNAEEITIRYAEAHTFNAKVKIGSLGQEDQLKNV